MEKTSTYLSTNLFMCIISLLSVLYQSIFNKRIRMPMIKLLIFMQLREYDKELGDFDGRLFEFPINFVPSYPFQEDVNEPVNYMQTRVPAWCDRVLLSPSAKALVQDVRALIKFTSLDRYSINRRA